MGPRLVMLGGHGVRRRPPRRGLAAALVASAVVLVVAERAGSWLSVGRVFWHPVAVELVASVLVVTASWLGLRSAKLAVAATVACVVITLPIVLVTWVLGPMEDPPASTERFPAPGGRWSAVVDRHAVHLMNDGSRVWIETHDGGRSRRWLAACLDADDPADDFYAFTWESPQQAQIETLRGDVHVLVLDPTTGRPLTRVDIGPAAAQICG